MPRNPFPYSPKKFRWVATSSSPDGVTVGNTPPATALAPRANGEVRNERNARVSLIAVS